MIKVIALLKRKPGMSFEEFDAHWKGQHGPLGAKLVPGLRKYTQSHILKAPESGQEIDGFVEMWFDDVEAYERFVSWRATSAADELDRDARQFVIPEQIKRYVVEELVVK